MTYEEHFKTTDNEALDILTKCHNPNGGHPDLRGLPGKLTITVTVEPSGDCCITANHENFVPDMQNLNGLFDERVMRVLQGKEQTQTALIDALKARVEKARAATCL